MADGAARRGHRPNADLARAGTEQEALLPEEEEGVAEEEREEREEEGRGIERKGLRERHGM